MEDKNNLKTKTLSSFVWKFAERCGVQGVGFIVSIILARMLTPDDYGLLALITVFTSILNVFVDCGLGSALIQKKDADDLDFSSVFFCNLAFCLVLYTLLYFAAPLIAHFYENVQLIPIIRVMGITILISGVSSIQSAYVSKHMIFKKFFYATLLSTIGSAVVGIIMAYSGFGVWALVVQQLFTQIFGTIVLWITVRWRPKKMFSFARLKGLFSFGWKLLVSSLINTVYNDIRQLIIGKLYSSADLGFYNKGKQFPNLVVQNVNTSIDSVLFPVLSHCQDDKKQLKQLTRRAISLSGYIMWPLMMGLVAVGKPMITLLLTEKWLPCLPYMYTFCFACGMMPIQTANLNAIRAMGRSDLTLKMEIIKKSINMVIIIISANISVFAIAVAGIPMTIVTSIVNIFPNRKLLGYGYSEQIKDILPHMFRAVVMAVVVYFVGLIPLPLIVTLIIQVLVGAAVYIAESVIFKVEIYTYLLDIIKGFIKK